MRTRHQGIRYSATAAALARLGYTGAVSLEGRASGPPVEALGVIHAPFTVDYHANAAVSNATRQDPEPARAQESVTLAVAALITPAVARRGGAAVCCDRLQALAAAWREVGFRSRCA